MSTKAIQARVIIQHPQQLQDLWRVHTTFNQYLPFVITQMFRMKRGEAGPEYKAIFDSIKSSQDAIGKMEAVTSLDWTSNKTDNWAQVAGQLIKQKKLLFDREKELPGLSSEFRRKLFEMAFQLIDGHQQLVKLWEEEHKEWLDKKRRWEEAKDHALYMKLRPLFQNFEEQEKVAKAKVGRWERWPLYLQFLKNLPKQAASLGVTLPPLNGLPPQAQQRVDKAKPSKRNRIEFDELMKANPDIRSLHGFHKFYESNYIRRGAAKRNADGFRHRPTFTLPSSAKHPAWYQFKEGATYKELDLLKGDVAFFVIGQTPNLKPRWTTFSFHSDPRLLLIRPASQPVKIGRETYSLVFADPHLKLDRPAEIKGIKLIFRKIKLNKNGALKTAIPYLVFTCAVPDMETRISVKQETLDRYRNMENLRSFLEPKLKSAPVTCAVDLGIRHLGVATIRKNGKITHTRFLWEQKTRQLPNDRLHLYRGADLHHVAKHKKDLRKGRSHTGRAAKGTRSFIQLQEHVDNMGKDRFKEGARKIVDFAYKNRADFIILERLQGLIPRAEAERGINRALMSWNRGHLAQWVKLLANDAGLRVVEVPSHWSSFICSRCDAWGTRYSLVKDYPSQSRQPQIEPVGKLFLCSECRYQANADFNASVNLHRVFSGEFPKVEPTNSAKTAYKITSKATGEVRIFNKNVAQEKAQAFLNAHFDLNTGSFRKA